MHSLLDEKVNLLVAHFDRALSARCAYISRYTSLYATYYKYRVQHARLFAMLAFTATER